jgi:hypothetical protein
VPTTFLTIPVSFGPHEADWWMVAVTMFGALTSLAVAISAFISARRARLIADRSEARRNEIEGNRTAQAYAERLDTALARLVSAISDQFAPIRDWLSTAEEVDDFNVTDRFGDPAYPDRPSFDAIDAASQLVRMIARGDDVPVAREIAFSLEQIETMPVRTQQNRLKSLVRAIRAWRAEELPAAAVITSLEKTRKASEAET